MSASQMPHQHTKPKRTLGWMGIHRGHRARPVERIAEWLIFGVSFSTIAIVFLIFIFVGKEALPVVFGRENSALIKEIIPSADIDKTPPEKLQAYLDLTRSEEHTSELQSRGLI